ncbi:ABC transporter ATP-binding protein [Capillimicrobium parvum]|uniref:Oligopeptide transport ATP-binding protein OppD n=1 Tax=Capillimicrobium parvum TaxID=2884022 RepID=A0A9E6Y2V5_9ACTN|nr:ABC transporter ATP-binding protein [Capillimicrobium parvum]UGS38436.1 Oligopeptide transport ATP-binding protein OppD [Capillimicrobium parvum]
MTPAPLLLEVRDFRLSLPIDGQQRPILRGVDLVVDRREAVALVGESGGGKSMLARAMLGLVPPRAQVAGDIRADGASVYAMSREDLRRYRATRVAMIFQDPTAHVNPVRQIGDFLTEALRTNQHVRGGEARRRVTVLLEEVGVPHAARRLRQYPHELSGGLLQRVMIAGALAAEPELLIADEPTTALDVTTQAEVMAILQDLRAERGLALLFVTHDLELAAAVCDRTAVMYAGEIVEEQSSEALHTAPRHPYTAALLDARPSVERSSHRLRTVAGRPVAAYEADAGCGFAPRCGHAQAVCAAHPPVTHIGSARVRCVRAEELEGRVAGDRSH